MFPFPIGPYIKSNIEVTITNTQDHKKSISFLNYESKSDQQIELSTILTVLTKKHMKGYYIFIQIEFTFY